MTGTMFNWILLAGAVLCEVAASLSLKGASDEPLLYIVVVAGYSAAFGALTAILKRGMPLGAAYGIWAAAGVALTAVMSSIIFREPFSPLMGGGLALIIAGVLLVETGTRTTDSEAV